MKNDTGYIYMVAKSAFIRHEPERAAQLCKEGMQLRFDPNLVLLYMAAVPDEMDLFRQALKQILGEDPYNDFSAKARQIRADYSLMGAIADDQPLTGTSLMDVTPSPSRQELPTP